MKKIDELVLELNNQTIISNKIMDENNILKEKYMELK